MRDVIVGVDLGGTNLKIAVVSQDRELLHKDSVPTPADEGPDAVLALIDESVRKALDATGRTLDNTMAVGVGIPGPMNWQTGVVFSPPNLSGWSNVPVAKNLGDSLGVPCFIDNDANVACYGEYWMGAGRGVESMAVLTLGTGVGGGVVVFGQLLRGIDGTAAELGHLKVQRDGRPCGCGGTGCLESYASVSGMVRTAREALQDGRDSALRDLCDGHLDAMTGKMIFNAANSGDEVARWVFEETATWLGLGIVSIIHYQNPERVVLCGGMIAAGELLFDPIRRFVKENAFEVPGARCEILPAGLGADSGVLGAAGCALARHSS